MDNEQPHILRRFLRWTYRATLAFLAFGLGLMPLGALLVPVAGWGGAYVFAVGLWSMFGAALPALVLLVSAVAFRVKFGHWYFGGDD